MRATGLLSTTLWLAACILATAGQPDGVIKGAVKYRWVENFPIVVYIEEVPGRKFTPPAKHAQVDQQDRLFVPRILPILVGTTVDFLNSDSYEHNVYSPDGERYDLGNWATGEKRNYTFKKPGVYTQLCKIHPEMIGYVVVLKTPYFAMTDKKGEFIIKNVPHGSYKLKVWGERLLPKQLEKTFEVKVEAGKDASVTIEP
jgi:plastocyanin